MTTELQTTCGAAVAGAASGSESPGKNWSPPPGDDNPMRLINGEWFNITIELEKKCVQRGKHRWGKDRFADDEGVQGYHYCTDCFRCEPL